MTMTGHPLEKIKKDMSRAVWKSFLGDDVAALAPSSGEDRAGVASMAWRSTLDFYTGPGIFIFRRTRPSSTASSTRCSSRSRRAWAAAGSGWATG